MARSAWRRAEHRVGGTLSGVKIVELAAIGPVPFCGMMLADHGAEVVHVCRPGAPPDRRDPLLRSRTVVEADLKTESGVAQVRELASSADGLIEGSGPA